MATPTKAMASDKRFLDALSRYCKQDVNPVASLLQKMKDGDFYFNPRPAGKSVMSRMTVKIISPTGFIEEVEYRNAHDMVRNNGYRYLNHGPEAVIGNQPNACEACEGLGHIDGAEEDCWHCGGEGVDPAKAMA